jgi:membrane-bound lytic murein transglycosylase D
MEYASEHNIYPAPPKYFDYETDTVEISNKVRFEQISAVIGVPVDEISYLNPTYKTGLIPGIAGESYVLTLPTNKIGDFINNEQAIYNYREPIEEDSTLAEQKPSEIAKESLVWHHVKNGDVLGLIAEKYNCSIRDIKDWNNFNNSRIYIGQKLIIYASAETKSGKSDKTPKTISLNETSKYKYHVIQSGDTLWDIAKLYEGVTISQLKKLNNINNEKRLKPGMKIKVSPISS